MKILTWNINGIRAVTGKSGVPKLLGSLDSDVVCLQETKVTRDMLDEPTAIVDGYEAYFSFSRKRTGYSGTANYCKKHSAPVCAEEGLTGRLNVHHDTSVGCYGNVSAYPEKDLDALDAEGRCVITQHRLKLPCGTETQVAIINVYVPRAGDSPDRLTYKLKFLTLLQNRAQALLKKNVHVIILGDLNLTHKKLDNCDPKSDADFQRRSSRIWINNVLQESERDPDYVKTHPDLLEVALHDNANDSEDDDIDEDWMKETVETSSNEGESSKAKQLKEYQKQSTGKSFLFSDAYRRLHPDVATGYTNWDSSSNARESNYGRRLDYILIDTELAEYITDCQILTEIEGSDHCPVVVTLNVQPLPSTASSPPQLCSKLMPEFRGQQQKLSNFFKKSVKQAAGDVGQVITLSQSSSSQSSQEDKVVSETSQKLPIKSISIPVAVTSSPEKKNFKRAASLSSKGDKMPPKKKQKQQAPKQASLSSFFTPKTHTSVTSKLTSSQMKEQVHATCETDNTKSCNDDDVICTDDINAGTSKASNNLQDSIHTQSGEINFVRKISLPNEQSNTSSTQSWKALLSGPAPPPLCPGHKEPCVLKTVRKNGPNKNKQFYSCGRPEGPPKDPQCRCNFFQWFHDRQKKKS